MKNRRNRAGPRETPLAPRGLIIDRPREGVFKVHSGVYTDRRVFDLEVARIWHGSWLFLAHESQVANPNDYLTTHMGRQPVILSRDETGKLRCFLNRCRHRGAMVCRSEMGNSSRFRCIYHGWSYRNDGELIGIPGREGYPKSLDESSLGLSEVPILDSYKGWIFASLSGKVPPLREHLGNARPYIDLMADKYEDGIEVVRGVQKFTMPGNWKLHVENTQDFYHPLITHKSFMQVVGALGRDNLTVRDLTPALDLGGGHSIVIHTAEHSIDAYEEGTYTPDPTELRERLGPRRAEWATRIKGFHLFVFPNLLVFDQGPPSFELRTIRPLGMNETDLAFYAWVPAGCSDEVRERILMTYVPVAGPAGMINIDDMEVMRAQTGGFRAESSPWSELSRGMGRERPDYPYRSFAEYRTGGPSTDDTIFRGFYRNWVERLS